MQDFRCSAGHGVETIVAQHGKVIADRHPRELHSVRDLHRREGVNVYLWDGRFYPTQDIAVVERRQTVWKSALNADFRGAKLPRFHGLGRHLFERIEVGFGMIGPMGERAEFASDK